jgi:hypothetical protein
MGAPKGTRPPGGSRKGIPNKATAAKAAAIAASGLTPLDYMLSILRDKAKPFETRLEAAKSAAPYVHPRLSSVESKNEHTGKDGGPIQHEVSWEREVERVFNDTFSEPESGA